MNSGRFVKWLIGISVLLATTIILIFVVPMLNIPGAEQSHLDDGQIFYEQVPHTILVPLEYLVVEAKYINRYWFAGADVWVTVKNTDTEGGRFTVNFELFAADGTSSVMTASQFVASGEAEQLMVYHDHGHIVYLKYNVLPPLKETIEYIEVTGTKHSGALQNITCSNRITIFEYLAGR